jgi:DnaJ-class molecular chaperone
MMLGTVPDFYKILDLPFGSSFEAIKLQYRFLAKVFHPDNLITGNEERFKEILDAYRTLTGSARDIYDDAYKRIFLKETTEEIHLPPERIVYTTNITFLAKHGLLKVGFRRKDRARYTGLKHDIDLMVREEEINKRVIVSVPLTVRVLCPECHGSNIHCECCGGIGNYKGVRNLSFAFDPESLVQNRVYEFELRSFRPDKFVHFKKKKFSIRIYIYK